MDKQIQPISAPQFEEVVILPPTLVEWANMPLLTDTQYLEPFTSTSLNRKFYGVVRRGIFRGFECIPNGGLSLKITSQNADQNIGVMLVERDDYILTVRQQRDIVINLTAGKNVYIVAEARYQHGVITKQVDIRSEIEAATIKVVDVGQEEPHQIILCKASVPAGTTDLTLLHLNFDDRPQGGYDFEGHVNHPDPHVQYERKDNAATNEEIESESVALKHVKLPQLWLAIQRKAGEAFFGRRINTLSPLNGGNDLGQDLTISIDSATTGKKGAVQLSNAHNGTSQTKATTEKALSDGLNLKVDKAAISSSVSSSSTVHVANSAAVQEAYNRAISAERNANDHTDNRISDLLGGAPVEALDTIKELGDALQGNSSAIGAINSEVAKKANKSTRINTVAPLKGAGDLSRDINLSIDSATTAQKGVVQLNDTVTSSSSVLALTAKMGKQIWEKAVSAYRLAETKITKAQGDSYYVHSAALPIPANADLFVFFRTAKTGMYGCGSAYTNLPEATHGDYWVINHGSGYVAVHALMNGGNSYYLYLQPNGGGEAWVKSYSSKFKPSWSDVGGMEYFIAQNDGTGFVPQNRMYIDHNKTPEIRPLGASSGLVSLGLFNAKFKEMWSEAFRGTTVEVSGSVKGRGVYSTDQIVSSKGDNQVRIIADTGISYIQTGDNTGTPNGVLRFTETLSSSNQLKEVDFRVANNNLTVNGHKVYSEGNKPSATDINAFKADGRAGVFPVDEIPWTYNSGVYTGGISGASHMVVHFRGADSCPASQLRFGYRNSGVWYKTARDGHGFEESWVKFYTTKDKPTPSEIGTYTSEQIDALVKEGSSGGVEAMIGNESSFPVMPANKAPSAAWIRKNGALLSRATYPALWAWASRCGLVISESDWQAHALLSVGGAVSKYSSGDGSTTFRIPSVGVNHLFQRALGTGALPEDANNEIRAYSASVQPLGVDTSKIKVKYQKTTHIRTGGASSTSTGNVTYGVPNNGRSSQAPTGRSTPYTRGVGICNGETEATVEGNTGAITGTALETRPDFQFVEIWIYTGNSEATVPVPTVDWLAQQQTNTEEIASFDSRMQGKVNEVNDAVKLVQAAGKFGFKSINEYAGYCATIGEGLDGKLYAWGDWTESNIPNGSVDGNIVGCQEVRIDYRGRKIKTYGLVGHNGYCLFEDGDLWVWGYNSRGTLGLGHTKQVTIPVLGHRYVEELVLPKSLAIDHNYYQVYMKHDSINGNGKWMTFGSNANNAMLGKAHSGIISTPMPIADLPNSDSVSKIWTMGGSYAVVFVRGTSGKLYASGYNGYGNLGTGNTTTQADWREISFEGVMITPTDTIIDIQSANGYHDTSTKSQSTTWFMYGSVIEGVGTKIFSCGDNDWGQLGLGLATGVNQTTPKALDFGGDYYFKKMVCGANGPAACFVLENSRSNNGRAWEWGYNGHGQLALGNTTTQPAPVEFGGGQIVDVYHNAGGHTYAYTCPVFAVFKDNTGRLALKSTGYNANGGLGVGDVAQKTVWTQTTMYDIEESTKIYCMHWGTSGNVGCFVVTPTGELHGCGYGGTGNISGPLHAQMHGTNSVFQRLH